MIDLLQCSDEPEFANSRDFKSLTICFYRCGVVVYVSL